MAQFVLTLKDTMNISGIVDFFKELRTQYTRYTTYKSTYRELSRLSDKELRDIGINRGMIRGIAMEVYTDAR